MQTQVVGLSMNEELHKKVINDLEKSGFGSEMKAIQTFLTRSNWKVWGHETFYDRDAQITREYDISAFYPIGYEAEDKEIITINFFITAEVKKSSRPWVVFKHIPQWSHELQDSIDSLLHAARLPASKYTFTEAISKDSIMDRTGQIGYGIHESFKDPKQPSQWYSAFTSAYKAAEAALLRESDNRHDKDTISQDLKKVSAFVVWVRPLVILDGILLSAGLSDDAEIEVEEINEASFEFRFSTANYKAGRGIIDLITLSNLNDYLTYWEKRHQKFLVEILKTSGIK